MSAEPAGSAGVTAVEKTARRRALILSSSSWQVRRVEEMGFNAMAQPVCTRNARVGAGVVTRYNRCILCEGPLKL